MKVEEPRLWVLLTEIYGASLADAPFMLGTFACKCPDGASEDGRAYSSKRNGCVFGYRRLAIVERDVRIDDLVRRTTFLDRRAKRYGIRAEDKVLKVYLGWRRTNSSFLSIMVISASRDL